MPRDATRRLVACGARSHNPAVARRIHVPAVHTGEIPLPKREAHHVRDVLRLPHGEAVEVFDDAGNVGRGSLVMEGVVVAVRVTGVQEAAAAGTRIVIASAVPKANRADWLIEKLSELGVDRFIPLATARSVVVPEGKNKLDRWSRLAIEAAKQSHRSGVMRIDAVTSLNAAISQSLATGTAWCLSTSPDAKPILDQILEAPLPAQLTLFIGPEGDWAPEETAAFTLHDIPGISLGPIILRVETASMVAAAVVAAQLNRNPVRQSSPTP
jgi:16S rRNA (uracil1498-N3)-methyltransferase